MLRSIEILDYLSQEKLDLHRIGVIYTRKMEFGKWIKGSRSAAGLNQTQLGDALGVSKGNVSAWENDRHEPSFSQMLRIYELTGKRLPLPGLDGAAWPFESIALQDILNLDPLQKRELEGVLRSELRHISGKTQDKSAAA